MGEGDGGGGCSTTKKRKMVSGMSKWKLVKTNNGTYVLERKEGDITQRVAHPLVIVRKAKQLLNRPSLNLFNYRAKKPDFRLSLLKWFSFSREENEIPAFISALDGKKLKITIEVIK